MGFFIYFLLALAVFSASAAANAETLISDIELLGYTAKKFKAFDMFPLTNHLEVLALLE